MSIPSYKVETVSGTPAKPNIQDILWSQEQWRLGLESVYCDIPRRKYKPVQYSLLQAMAMMTAGRQMEDFKGILHRIYKGKLLAWRHTFNGRIVEPGLGARQCWVPVDDDHLLPQHQEGWMKPKVRRRSRKEKQ